MDLAALYDVPVSQLLRRSSVHPTDIAEELADALSHLTDGDRLWVRQWLTELCERLAARSGTGHRPAKRGR
jgi:hypothetical protein